MGGLGLGPPATEFRTPWSHHRISVGFLKLQITFWFQKRGFKKKTDVYNKVPDSGAHFIGYFKNGQAVGNFWIGLANNGFLHGIVDKNGLITGENICFIYPDGFTALCGFFENTFMTKAKHVEIREYGCNKNGLLEATKFTQPIDQNEFFYDPPTNESWGGGSKEIHDPFELKNVVLKQSMVPNSGEGEHSQTIFPIPISLAKMLGNFLGFELSRILLILFKSLKLIFR